MKPKVDRGLLPVKIHFFFFFAVLSTNLVSKWFVYYHTILLQNGCTDFYGVLCVSALGPLLPQMNVFGRQLGVSPGVMGMVTAVLPLLWAAAKPLFGYVVDYWPNHRKLVFMLLIVVMSGSYCSLWFLPMPDETNDMLLESVYSLNDTIYLKPYDDQERLNKYNCHWNCTAGDKFDVYLSNSSYISTMYVDGTIATTSCSLLHMETDSVREGDVACVPVDDCNLLCYEVHLNRTRRGTNSEFENLVNKTGGGDNTVVDGGGSFYVTATFWAFVVLMCVGTVAFNVANCIGDAVCFDVLGPNRGSQYGAQRAWGTAGYGITALLGGWLIDMYSGRYKDFTPAFLIALVATVVDLASCRALTLPSLSSPEDSGKALREVLKIPRVVVFIIFAVVAGTFDSFIIYYMFWFLEDLAERTGSMAQIKLIEGAVVAAQSFVGELLFFFFSGKIIDRWGFGATMTFSLFCYGIRMILISFIQHPWHLVFIEGIMQGPTYALCYSTIVGYAAHVAPEGYSATVQGIVAGMDDGVGFALGSLVGGQLYASAGERGSFRILAGVALLASVLHAVLFKFVTRKGADKRPEVTQEEGEKMLPIQHNNSIYRDTVLPAEKTDR